MTKTERNNLQALNQELKARIISMVELYNKSEGDKGTSLALMETDKNDSGIETATCLVKDWWSSHCYYEEPAIQWQYDCGLLEPEEDEDEDEDDY